MCECACVCVCACAARSKLRARPNDQIHTINGIFVSLFNFVSLFMFLLYLILCI